ncbi:Hypothetical protein FKW44_011507, partial [Caligus rogercresseyi]
STATFHSVDKDGIFMSNPQHLPAVSRRNGPGKYNLRINGLRKNGHRRFGPR